MRQADEMGIRSGRLRALSRRLDHSHSHACASYPSCFGVYPRGSRSRVFCFLLASARRSVFFRRFARFLALVLPWLCPISFKAHPLAPFRHVVVSTKTASNSKSRDVTSGETEAGVCAVAAFDAVSAPAHLGVWSLAHPALAPTTWLLRRLPARVPRR